MRRMNRPVAASQRRITPSLQAEARYRPSGLKTTRVTVNERGQLRPMGDAEELMVALPLQIAPLPTAEQRGAVFQQSFDAIDVVGRELAFGQRHAIVVQEGLGVPALLLGPACLIGPEILVAELDVVSPADSQTDHGQGRHGDHRHRRGLGRVAARVPPRPLPEPSGPRRIGSPSR